LSNALSNRWFVLVVTGVALVLSLTTWYSATAIVPELTLLMSLSLYQAAWFTNSVQVGFVFGALSLSLLSLLDIYKSSNIMAISACIAGIANAILILEPGIALSLFSRFITGMALAGIYPTVIKFIATWFKKGRGFAMGIMLSSLTLGSALPHLVRAIGVQFDWELVISMSSLACLTAAGLFAFVLQDGPHKFSKTKADLNQLRRIIKDRPLMLVNIGYFGHMWELYAMWGWFFVYAIAAKSTGLGLENAALLTFSVIAAGAPGCVLGGWLADRIGRCYATVCLMFISGTCALTIGLCFNGPSWLFFTIALIWGLTAVADSAQFSAAVTELSDKSLVGSALALQMGVGFAITIFVIWLLPVVAEHQGSWRWTFLILAPGPFLGALSMLLLRSEARSHLLADGRR
jgi:MFS family permease